MVGSRKWNIKGGKGTRWMRWNFKADQRKQVK
jgi:hypothetical protein